MFIKEFLKRDIQVTVVKLAPRKLQNCEINWPCFEMRCCPEDSLDTEIISQVFRVATEDSGHFDQYKIFPCVLEI